MKIVKSQKTGREYEVQREIYGIRNHGYRLSYGGIFVASFGGYFHNHRSLTMSEAIETADKKVEELGNQGKGGKL